MIKAIKRLRWACWEWLAKFLARSYIVGPELEDAMEAYRRMAKEGTASTICYWNIEDDAPEQVAAAYCRAIDALGQEKATCYLSIKAPALHFDRVLHQQVAERARQNGVRLHFDSLAPETADETFSLIAGLLPVHPDLGCTLPGRWRRSLADADWAVERDARVRVVKGQWVDPAWPEADMREGFLAVIDRLAGRAVHVAVATHDAPLAKEALARLRKKNTPCELELLFGLPMRPARAVAQEAEVPVRIYLPYGHGWVPYIISQAYKNPKILWWVFKDLF